jgi:uncharacterized protein (TIGR03000 family)
VQKVIVTEPPVKSKPRKKKARREKTALEPASATVVVRLPADAKLYVDGVACPLTSEERTFKTPRLQPGRQYYYTIRAELVRDGEPVVDSRRVLVSAGKRAEVDFGELATVSADED